jgi:uncharacterized protein
VDLHGLLGLNDPIGFFICLAGLTAQLWVTRRNKLLFAASCLLAVFILITFGSIAEFWWKWYLRQIPVKAMPWITAIIQLWCISLVGIAVALELRNRVIPYRESRRHLLRLSTAAICAAPPAVFTFGIITRKDFTIKEIDLKLPHLPRDLENVRIVQISDIHLSAFYREQDFARVIDAANGLRGDLAIVTGDLITGSRDPLPACLKQISRLKNTSGIWGCMGNHEHFAGVENAAEKMGARLGVNFLRSEAKVLRFGSHSINLVGVDYQSPRLPYLVNAEELVESGPLNILLSHNPDVFPVASSKGFDLVLAGHTHGGQVNVEIFDNNINPARFVTPYTRGLYTDAFSAVYVNSGIGTIGIPIRLGDPPEISVIKLCAS